MKIFITAQTIVKNDLYREHLQNCCPNATLIFCTLPSSPTKTQFADLLGSAEIIVVGQERIGDSELVLLPNLKTIIKYGVGLDNVDFGECHRKSIRVLRQDGINSDSVAEFTLGLMLASSYRFVQGHQSIVEHQWKKQYGSLLAQKTIAIIGVGAIGSKVARHVKHALGCNLLLHDIVDKSGIAQELDAKICSLEEATEHGDIITLHVPLTEQTKHLINEARLAKMKSTLILINTSRGRVVDEYALAAFLQKNSQAYAALDVFGEEPLLYKKSAFSQVENILLTPHSAGSAREIIQVMVNDIAEKINAEIKP